MDAFKAIEDRVAGGFVLNNSGLWVRIYDQVVHEKRTVEELARGNVYVNGAWVRIADAKKPAKPPAALLPAPPPALNESPVSDAADASPFEPEENMIETIRMDTAMIKQIRDMIHGSGANVQAAAFAPPPPPAPAVFEPLPLTPAPAADDDSFCIPDVNPGNAHIATDADFTGQDDMRETAVLMVDDINQAKGRA
jgi:hypothetical protein